MTKKMIYYLCSVLALGLIVFVSSKTAPKQNNVPEINQTETKEENKNTEQQPEQVSATASSEAKDIFATIESENLWAVDVNDPQTLINGARPGVQVSTVKIKITSIDDSVFFEAPSGSQYSSQRPVTPIEVETIEFINGSEVPEHFTLYVTGGEVTIAEYMKILESGEIEKTGLNSLTRSEQENKYISFTTESSYQFEIGKEYVCIIEFSEKENMYALSAEGYSIFIEKSTDKKAGKSTPEYENVLTQKDLSLE